MNMNHDQRKRTAAQDLKPTNPKDMVGSMKAPVSTVPAVVIAEVGVAMLEGRGKYGGYNFRGMGALASIYYDAAMGHLMSWWEGEDIDQDSGLNHVTKAIASLCVLRDCMINGVLRDDRPPALHEPFKQRMNARAREIIQSQMGSIPPRHYTIADRIGCDSPTGPEDDSYA